ncbi:MAG: hypothetical protein IIB83_07925 [Bacteroidetes bacterium]|nr:hypothetical protein [Bacteroidota bacterium]
MSRVKIIKSKNMKIELTKEQYRELITIIEISNSVLGVLGDSFPDGDYKEESQKLERLKRILE